MILRISANSTRTSFNIEFPSGARSHDSMHRVTCLLPSCAVMTGNDLSARCFTSQMNMKSELILAMTEAVDHLERVLGNL